MTFKMPFCWKIGGLYVLATTGLILQIYFCAALPRALLHWADYTDVGESILGFPGFRQVKDEKIWI